MPGRIKIIVFRHWLALVIALVVGLIYASHHFFIPRLIANSDAVYYPITRASYLDEATFYGIRANAVFQGQLSSGDASVAEYKGVPTLLPILNPLVMGLAGRSAGSLARGFILSDFLFPAIIFLLVYAIAWELSGRKLPSLVFASLFVFIPKVGIYIPPVSLLNLRELLYGLVPFLHPRDVLPFTQFDEPKITFLFSGAAAWLLIRALTRNERWTTVLAGIAFGSLFYTYPYDLGTFLVLLVFLGVIFLWKKDYTRLLRLAVIGGVGIAVSILYWFNVIRVRNNPQYHELTARIGGELSHRFRIATVWKSYLRDIVLTLAMVAMGRKKAPLTVTILGAWLLTYLVTVNVQVITGFNLHPDHWYRTQFLPVALSIFMLCLWIGQWVGARGIKKYAPSVGAVFLFYILASQGFGQYRYSVAHASDYTIPREVLQSYEWLNTHTPKGSVVGTISFASNYDLLLHTHNKVFVPFGLLTASPDQELWVRFMAMSRLYGISVSSFEEMLHGGAYYLFTEAYGSRGFDSSFHGYTRQFPDELLREKTADYRRLLATPLDAQSPYRLDYLYVGEDEMKIGGDPIKILPSLKIVYKSAHIKIYQNSSQK